MLTSSSADASVWGIDEQQFFLTFKLYSSGANLFEAIKLKVDVERDERVTQR
jgi:hypothetical protein